jgi:hypothetical protein
LEGIVGLADDQTSVGPQHRIKERRPNARLNSKLRMETQEQLEDSAQNRVGVVMY